MIECDALIVGGGPAGSTCARALRQAGWDVIVHRSCAISARQGVRRMVDARGVPTARSGSRRAIATPA